MTALYVHLVFAVSTVILWPTTIVLALRNFPNPPMPGQHSRIHMPLARIAADRHGADGDDGLGFLLGGVREVDVPHVQTESPPTTRELRVSESIAAT